MRCPKCGRAYEGTDVKLGAVVKTKHHVLPRRWFGSNNETINICRSPCHDDLETLIQREEQGRQLSWIRYYEIVNEFVGYTLLEV
jgi:hypothetical protein